MWLNKLFIEEPIDFEKRCKNRVAVGAVIGLLGLGTWAVSLYYIHVYGGTSAFAADFYTGAGVGLMIAGLLLFVRNRKYLLNEKLGNDRKRMETDERNRLLGLRSWAYAGYAMFMSLYLGILISGFFSETVMITLMAVWAVYGVFLVVFRTYLNKLM